MNIHRGKLCRIHSRKAEKVVHDLRSTKRLCCDLLEKLVRCISGSDLFAQHLRIAGNDGQRRIDLVSHSGSQQPDRSELFVLNELIFEADAIGDVINDDQTASRRAGLIQQRRDREVDGEAAPLLLVEVAVLRETVQEIRRYGLFRRPARRSRLASVPSYFRAPCSILPFDR